LPLLGTWSRVSILILAFPSNKTDKGYGKGKQRVWKDVVLSETDYAAIVDAGDHRGKLRVVWLAQTGMRLGDIQKLKVRDLAGFDLDKLETLEVPMRIEYLPEKTESRGGGERYTFLGEYGIWPLTAELSNRIEQ
jgi:integrase